MPAFWIVEPFNVIEDIGAQFIAGAIPPPTKALCLKGGEETFHCGVIPAIAAAAHTANDTMCQRRFKTDTLFAQLPI
jgi:hypothetical protein